MLDLAEPPTTAATWYTAAAKSDNNWRKEQAINKYLTGLAKPKARIDFRPRNESPRYTPQNRDPMAMDIDRLRTEQGEQTTDIGRLSTTERNEHMQTGRCFACHQPGHRVAECPQNNTNQSNRPNTSFPRNNTSYSLNRNNNYTPMQKNATQTHTAIRAMIQELQDDEKQQFYEIAKNEGF